MHLTARVESTAILPTTDDALRDEFADVDKSADELREDAREAALDEAGR